MLICWVTALWLAGCFTTSILITKRNRSHALEDWVKWNRYHAIANPISIGLSVWFGITLAQYVQGL